MCYNVTTLFCALVFWLQGMWDPSSRWSNPPTSCSGRWRPVHWTSKEVPRSFFNLKYDECPNGNGAWLCTELGSDEACLVKTLWTCFRNPPEAPAVLCDRFRTCGQVLWVLEVTSLNVYLSSLLFFFHFPRVWQVCLCYLLFFCFCFFFVTGWAEFLHSY